MSEYPKYGSVKSCVKCGAREMGPGMIFDRKYETHEFEDNDWINVACYHCGYVWKEACMDAEDES